MAYYKQVLRPAEQVQYLGRLHWIIYLNGALLFLIGCVVIAVAMDSASQAAMNPDDYQSTAGYEVGVSSIGTILLLSGVFSILIAAIRRNTTEIVVTTSRVIFKVGIIGRRTAEMNISKIETVDVLQSVLGRAFGFGAVILRGTGSTFEPLNRVKNPLELRNAILIG